ncbi:MAG: hypothetical protein P8182_12680, partial [Deltaproteobacteria bacterium]
SEKNEIFRKVCRDVLGRDTVKVTRSGQSLMPEMIDEVIAEVCSKRNRQPGGQPTANCAAGGGKREQASRPLKTRSH